MENPVIAVGSAHGATSPVMPYIGEHIHGHDFIMPATLYLEAALLRCGFNVLCLQAVEPQDLIMQANRHNADAVIMMSYAAFGSGKSFNDEHGAVVRYSHGRQDRESRVLCEDICAKLSMYKKASVAADGTLGGASCPTVVIDGGYLTNFDEAKLACDPDNAVKTAEHAALGICEHFGIPYVMRDDIAEYPLLSSAATGKRGNKVKLLQTLLRANGSNLTIDGVYGRETDLAAKVFCINNGAIAEQMSITPSVWRDLLVIEPPTLPLGSKHSAVLYVQRKLFGKLYKTPRDGVLGGETIHAVNEFISEAGGDISLASDNEVSADAIKFLSSSNVSRPRLY